MKDWSVQHPQQQHPIWWRTTIGFPQAFGINPCEAGLMADVHGECKRTIEKLENELESVKRITFCVPSNRSFLINHADWWRGLRWGLFAGGVIGSAIAYWLS